MAEWASIGTIFGSWGAAVGLDVVVILCYLYSFLAPGALTEVVLGLTLHEPVLGQPGYLHYLEGQTINPLHFKSF